jgi:hypothetical protein
MSLAKTGDEQCDRWPDAALRQRLSDLVELVAAPLRVRCLHQELVDNK